MAFCITFVRQEIEALIDLLERNPDEYIHDKSAPELADELKVLIGMRKVWPAGLSSQKPTDASCSALPGKPEAA